MRLSDVAEAAGVSVTTVSRVVNGDQKVHPLTRARVQRAMEELKYYPNLHARSLAGGQDKTLGVILSNLENAFFTDIYRHFEVLANKRGYETILAASHYDSVRLQTILRMMIGRRVAGLAAIVSEMQPEITAQMESVGIPFVCYDFLPKTKNVSSIVSKYGSGMRRLIEYLHDLGHRKIGFVAYRLQLGPTEDRRIAFLETTESYSILTHVATPSAEGLAGGREAAVEIMESGFCPTAIVCVNDVLAVGVLKELHERGVRVPAEISVTGFDNIQLGQYTIPSLTTMNVPRERIAELAFSALVAHDGASLRKPRTSFIEPELIVRGSTGAAITHSRKRS